MYIIGIDGGGTKTKALLYKHNHGIIWSGDYQGSNPHSIGFEKSIELILKIIKDAYVQFNLKALSKIYIGIGIAGLGRKKDQDRWLHIFNQNLSSDLKNIKLFIEDDSKIALYAETYGEDGIVSICGTGSIIFGLHQNKFMRVGGWGPLIEGDPGSGYYLGLQVLKAVFQQKDELGKSTILTDLILKKENLKSVELLIPTVYEKKMQRERIASYAELVFKASALKDDVAEKILQETIDLVIFRSTHLYTNLFKSNEHRPVKFILAGGIYKNKHFREEVESLLKKHANFEIIQATKDLALGSIVHVLKSLNYEPSLIKKLLG